MYETCLSEFQYLNITVILIFMFSQALTDHIWIFEYYCYNFYLYANIWSECQIKNQSALLCLRVDNFIKLGRDEMHSPHFTYTSLLPVIKITQLIFHDLYSSRMVCFEASMCWKYVDAHICNETTYSKTLNQFTQVSFDPLIRLDSKCSNSTYI